MLLVAVRLSDIDLLMYGVFRDQLCIKDCLYTLASQYQKIRVRMRMGLFFYSGIVHSSKDRTTIGYRLLETYEYFRSSFTDFQRVLNLTWPLDAFLKDK
jgi:hypothetical protein